MNSGDNFSVLLTSNDRIFGADPRVGRNDDVYTFFKFSSLGNDVFSYETDVRVTKDGKEVVKIAPIEDKNIDVKRWNDSNRTRRWNRAEINAYCKKNNIVIPAEFTFGPENDRCWYYFLFRTFQIWSFNRLLMDPNFQKTFFPMWDTYPGYVTTDTFNAKSEFDKTTYIMDFFTQNNMKTMQYALNPYNLLSTWGDAVPQLSANLVNDFSDYVNTWGGFLEMGKPLDLNSVTPFYNNVSTFITTGTFMYLLGMFPMTGSQAITDTTSATINNATALGAKGCWGSGCGGYSYWPTWSTWWPYWYNTGCFNCNNWGTGSWGNYGWNRGWRGYGGRRYNGKGGYAGAMIMGSDGQLVPLSRIMNCGNTPCEWGGINAGLNQALASNLTNGYTPLKQQNVGLYASGPSASSVPNRTPIVGNVTAMPYYMSNDDKDCACNVNNSYSIPWSAHQARTAAKGMYDQRYVGISDCQMILRYMLDRIRYVEAQLINCQSGIRPVGPVIIPIVRPPYIGGGRGGSWGGGGRGGGSGRGGGNGGGRGGGGRGDGGGRGGGGRGSGGGRGGMTGGGVSFVARGETAKAVKGPSVSEIMNNVFLPLKQRILSSNPTQGAIDALNQTTTDFNTWANAANEAASCQAYNNIFGDLSLLAQQVDKELGLQTMNLLLLINTELVPSGCSPITMAAKAAPTTMQIQQILQNFNKLTGSGVAANPALQNIVNMINQWSASPADCRIVTNIEDAMTSLFQSTSDATLQSGITALIGQMRSVAPDCYVSSQEELVNLLDINQDGTISIEDLSVLIENLGTGASKGDFSMEGMEYFSEYDAEAKGIFDNVLASLGGAGGALTTLGSQLMNTFGGLSGLGRQPGSAPVGSAPYGSAPMMGSAPSAPVIGSISQEVPILINDLQSYVSNINGYGNNAATALGSAAANGLNAGTVGTLTSQINGITSAVSDTTDKLKTFSGYFPAGSAPGSAPGTIDFYGQLTDIQKAMSPINSNANSMQRTLNGINMNGFSDALKRNISDLIMYTKDIQSKYVIASSKLNQLMTIFRPKSSKGQYGSAGDACRMYGSSPSAPVIGSAPSNADLMAQITMMRAEIDALRTLITGVN